MAALLLLCLLSVKQQSSITWCKRSDFVVVVVVVAVSLISVSSHRQREGKEVMLLLLCL